MEDGQGRSSPAGARRGERSSLPRLQTNNGSSSNRFSWTATPAQEQRPTFEEPAQARPYTIIDESPMGSPVQHAQAGEHSHRAEAPPPLPGAAIPGGYPAATVTATTIYHAASPYTEDKKSPPPDFEQPHAIPTPRGIHPAHFAPYAEASPVQSNHLSQHFMQPPVPLGSIAGPTYQQETSLPSAPMMAYPAQPQSPGQVKVAASPGDHKRAGPPSPLEFQAARSPSIPAYTPASPMGPNASAFHLGHRPGQVEHPLSAAHKGWHGATAEPSCTCLFALACPCVLYGRVQYRLGQRARKQAATDLLGYGACNRDCAIMALACGLQGLLAAVQRYRVRRAYDIDGGVADDCLHGCCCCCCTIARDEREIVLREEERRRLAGPSSGAGYVSTGRLEYAPPPR